MEARSAVGAGIKDGTVEIESVTSTDEIFSNYFIPLAYIIYDICLVHAT